MGCPSVEIYLIFFSQLDEGCGLGDAECHFHPIMSRSSFLTAGTCPQLCSVSLCSALPVGTPEQGGTKSVQLTPEAWDSLPRAVCEMTWNSAREVWLSLLIYLCLPSSTFTSAGTHRHLFCTVGYDPILRDFFALTVQHWPSGALSVGSVSL